MKIDGRTIAAQMYDNLKNRVGELQKKGVTPHLAVILVGNDPGSLAFIKQKRKFAEAIQAKVTVFSYEPGVTIETLLKKIRKLNADKNTYGIIVQLPVPGHLNAEQLTLAVDPKKDIDGFHPKSPFTVPLVAAVMKTLEKIYSLELSSRIPLSGVRDPQHSSIKQRISLPSVSRRTDRRNDKQGQFFNWLKSKQILAIGKGKTAGGPIITYLEKHNITPVVIDGRTRNPDQLIHQADIIISSVGKPDVIKAELVKKDVILIGVGLYRGEDGKLHGDYDEEKIEHVASFYTPTPGGIGPVNVACLLENLIATAEKLTFA